MGWKDFGHCTITNGWSHLDTYGRSPDLGYNPKQSPKKEATIACVNLQKRWFNTLTLTSKTGRGFVQQLSDSMDSMDWFNENRKVFVFGPWHIKTDGYCISTIQILEVFVLRHPHKSPAEMELQNLQWWLNHDQTNGWIVLRRKATYNILKTR